MNQPHPFGWEERGQFIQNWLDGFLSSRRRMSMATRYAVALTLALLIGIATVKGMQFAVALFVVVLVMAITTATPRLGLLATLPLLVLEGAARKWILPQAQDLIYFGKDVLLLGTYLGVAHRLINERPPSRIAPLSKPIAAMLSIYAFYIALELFNPRNPSLALGVFGLRNYLVYIPMIFVVPILIPTRSDFIRLLRYFFVLAIPVGILGAVQFVLPYDHWLNQYVWGDLSGTFTDLTGNTRHARVTATFSYISGYAAYLTVTVLLLMPFMFYAARQRLWFYLGTGLLLAGNLLANGSRAPVFLLIGSVPLFAQLSGFGAGGSTIRSLIIRRLVVLVLIGGVGLSYFFREPLNAFRERASITHDAETRILGVFTRPFGQISDAGPFGYGLASAHQARASMMSLFGDDGPLPNIVEDESARIVQEIGVVGFILWYGIRLLMLIWLFQNFRNEPQPLWKLICLSIFLTHLTTLPVSLVVNHTMLFLFWFLTGAARIPADALPKTGASPVGV